MPGLRPSLNEEEIILADKTEFGIKHGRKGAPQNQVHRKSIYVKAHRTRNQDARAINARGKLVPWADLSTQKELLKDAASERRH